MGIMSKLSNAFKVMDSYIQPPPTLLKRIMILLDKKIMHILYEYNTDDYYLYEFYRLKLSARKAFIGQYNGIKKIEHFLNNTADTVKFNDKTVFNKVFSKYLHRDWLSLLECSFNEFCDFCALHPDFIKKPLDQLGGVGIEKLTITNDVSLQELYDKLKCEKCLIEEIVIQDKAIASFNPPSVNTIRIYSILNKSKVIIVDAYLRMGVGEVAMDNFHSGGIAAKIDVDTGIITTPGKNRLSQAFILHPYTKKQVIGFVIPMWEEIKKTVEEAALVVPTVRYVAWDVVINNKGDICFIEGNHNGGFNLQEAIDLQGKKSKYKKLLEDIR
jgi:hypothetical protein